MTRDEHGTLKKSFTRTMQARILSGELKPGDKLLPERELAAEMGISRGSVNQGLLDLERMGFIRIVPRKGTFVADYMSGTSPETLAVIMQYDSALIDPDLFRDLMEMRTLIERESVRLACLRAGTADIEALNELTDRIYSSQGAELTEAMFEFHHHLTVCSGNRAYALLFHSFEKMILSLIEVHYSEPSELRRARPLYYELSRSISRGDTQQADELILEILSTATDYLNKLL